MSRTEPVVPLSVATDDLTLTVEGVEIDVTSTGDRLFLEVPTVRGALRVVRSLPADSEPGGIARFLRAGDLTTEIRVRGRTVAVLGADARPGVLARRLGVAPAEVRPAAAVSAAGDGVRAALGAVRRLGR